MDQWIGGLFRGIFLTTFGVAICSFGTWVAFRLAGWKRLLMIMVAIVGIMLIFYGLNVFVVRFNTPLKY